MREPAQLVPGQSPAGASVLSLVCKRTYSIAGDRLALAPEQVPLFSGLVPEPDRAELIRFDSDLYAWKPLTDVIVVGHAHAPEGVTSFDAAVHVGPHRKQLLVHGDRRCALTAAGRVTFSPPERVERVPLRDDHTYGGHDAEAERRLGDPAAAMKAALPPAQRIRASLYAYPRNFYGKGYLVEATREAVEAISLPNLEDPADRLTPDRLASGSVNAWPRMPLPWSLGVLDHGHFPRLGFAGFVPWHDPLPGPIAEVARGFAPARMMSNDFRSPEEKMDHRFQNSASLGLQLPPLRGDEAVALLNLHPRRPRLAFALPGERPRLSLRGAGGALEEAEPVLHSVIVEPDEDRVTLVWRGAVVVKKPLTPAEVEKTPFLVAF